MDYRNNNDPYSQQNQNGYIYRTGGWSTNPGQPLATASMFLGIAAVFTMFTIYLPLVFGSLAILFALLSKGYGRKLLASAKVGIISGGCGLAVISSVLGILTAFFLLSSGDELIQMGRQLDQQFETRTGVPLEEIMGESYEDLMTDFVSLTGK